LLGGVVAVAALGVLVGVANAALVELIGLTAIVATLATASILNGISLQLRPVSGGEINSGFAKALITSWGFMPVSFIAVLVVAVAWDVWLYRSRRGLQARAVGLNPSSAQRLGTNARWTRIAAFIICSLMSAVAGFFLGAWIRVGDPNSGASYTLLSVAACIVGGASFLGGRGTFIGAVLGSLFFFLIINALPFLNVAPDYSYVITGALTLVALAFNQAPEIVARAKQTLDDVRRVRTVEAP